MTWPYIVSIIKMSFVIRPVRLTFINDPDDIAYRLETVKNSDICEMRLLGSLVSDNTTNSIHDSFKSPVLVVNTKWRKP